MKNQSGFFARSRERYEQGDYSAALAIAQDWLASDAEDCVALNIAAGCAKLLGDAASAEAYWRRAIEIKPQFADAHYNLGVLFTDLERLPEAEAAYRQAIALQPAMADGWRNLGIVLNRLGRAGEAEAVSREALRLQPANPEYHYNLGVVLAAQGRATEAQAAYRRALELNPEHSTALNNLGVLLSETRCYADASAVYRRALVIDPGMPELHNNLGSTLLELGQYAAAEAAYREALKLKPGYADAASGLGNALRMQQRYGEAEAAYRCAFLHCPDSAQALSQIVRVKRHAAAWQGLADDDMAIRRWLERDQPGAVSPFALLVLPTITAAEHLRASRLWAESSLARELTLSPLISPQHHYGHGRLRIGYLSADFYEHATMYLLAGVLEAHDPQQFSVHAYSYGPARDDPARRRVQTACTVFRDLHELSDEAAARQIAADEIDILVDLKGYTQDCRMGITARRPAPVIVGWLGYPGTLGHPRLADYLIGDPVVTPLVHAAHFSETLALLPHCYQPNDRARAIGSRPSRAEAGLPEHGFVFCSFNLTAKLNPEVFDVWCRLLNAVPHSVLWLLQPTDEAMANLQREAVARGVAAERLIFAPRQALTQHLSRLQLADLALDTYPYGSHTSGSDALWAGVPLLTRIGETFASRVAASLLYAVGLPELVTEDWTAYFELARALALEPMRLATLRTHLIQQRLIAPLFDTPGFARDLGALYRQIWEDHRACRRVPITMNPRQVPPQLQQDAAALHVRALTQLQAGDAPGAAAFLRQAIALAPNVAAYHSNLAVALRGHGTTEQRIALYRRAIGLDPGDPIARANLAAVLTETSAFFGAEDEARAALQLAPGRVETWFNLGGALAGQKRWADAAAAFDSALQYQPGSLLALQSAAKAHRAAGQLGQAVAHYREARTLLTTLPPDQSAPLAGPICHALGEVLAECLDHTGAEQCFREALRCLPDDLALLTDLGNSLKAQGRLDEAADCYRCVVAGAPHLPGAQVNLGTLFQTLGHHEEAVAQFRAALALDPKSLPTYSNLGTSLTYSAHHGPADLKLVYDEFDRIVAQPLRDPRPHTNDRNPDRRLRVGYVSPDFRKHAVAYFALPLLEGHYPEQFEVVCYYNHRQEDEWTRRFRGLAGQWVDCVAMDDAALAERIRADRIDILVDLAGHTQNNRLLVFARKPAPVQVTWMGYVTTTGLSAMDYRLSHADADPPGVDAHYSERLWRLPGTMWCYRPLPGMPEVTPAPVLEKGYVSFGSLNRYSKNSTLVLEAWSNILNRVPDSRLVICVPEGSVRIQMLRFFAERGISPERISAFDKLSHDDFWKLHDEVDIALDPFPFNGGTTTCESLWLGVPVVTITGSSQPATNTPDTFHARFASRMGQAFLTNIGLPELAVETLPQYVDIAIQLARDVPRLVSLRQSLRPRMTAAPLTDEVRFVREMEQAYRAMWRGWCAIA